MTAKLKQQKRKASKKKQRELKIKKQAISMQGAPGEPIEDQVREALALLREDHFKEGKHLLEKLGRKHGGHPLVQYSMGVLAAKRERYEEAAKWFEKTVKTAPDYIDAHYNLAVAYQKLNDYTHMALAFQYVIDHGEPGSLPVKHAVQTLSKLEEGLREKQGIGLKEFLEGYMCFQRGLEHMDAREWNEAVASFQAAIQGHPDNTQSYGNLGICYAALGKRQEALDAFNKALELDPAYEPARQHRDLVAMLKEGDALEEHVKGMDYNQDDTM